MRKVRYFLKLFKIKTLITVLMSLCIFITSVFASSDPADKVNLLSIKDIKTCVVQLAHWGEKDKKSGMLKGIYPEIFEEFSRRSGIKLNLMLAPYPRVMHFILSDDGCDLTISLPSDAVMDQAKIGVNIWTIKMGIISKPFNHIDKYHHLHGQNIGLLRGARISQKFDSDTSFNKVTFVNYSKTLKMLKADRIDAIAGDIEIINSIIHHTPKLRDRFSSPLLLTELPLHVIVSSKFRHLQYFPKLNEVFISMKDDGTIKKIIYDNLKVLDKPLSFTTKQQ